MRLLQLAKEELESRKEQLKNAALGLEQAKTAIMLLELDKKRGKDYSEGLEEQMQQLHKAHAEQELQMARMQQVRTENRCQFNKPLAEATRVTVIVIDPIHNTNSNMWRCQFTSDLFHYFCSRTRCRSLPNTRRRLWRSS